MTPPMRPCVMKVFAPFSTQHVAVARGRRPHAGGVAAGSRLGQAPGAEHLAAAPAATRYRCFCASVPNMQMCAEHEPVVRGDRQRDRRIRRAPAPRCRCSSRPPTSPAPPYSSGNWMPIRPSAGQLRQQLDREMLRLVPLHDVRPDLGLRELADGPPQNLLLLGEPEVHRGFLTRSPTPHGHATRSRVGPGELAVLRPRRAVRSCSGVSYHTGFASTELGRPHADRRPMTGWTAERCRS